MCMCVCLLIRVQCTWRSEEDVISSGCCEPPWWELENELLTARVSPQPRAFSHVFYLVYYLSSLLSSSNPEGFLFYSLLCILIVLLWNWGSELTLCGWGGIKTPSLYGFLTDVMSFENGTVRFPLCGFVPLLWCVMASGRVCLRTPHSVPLMANLDVHLILSNHLKGRGSLGKPVCVWSRLDWFPLWAAPFPGLHKKGRVHPEEAFISVSWPWMPWLATSAIRPLPLSLPPMMGCDCKLWAKLKPFFLTFIYFR